MRSNRPILLLLFFIWMIIPRCAHCQQIYDIVSRFLNKFSLHWWFHFSGKQHGIDQLSSRLWHAIHLLLSTSQVLRPSQQVALIFWLMARSSIRTLLVSEDPWVSPNRHLDRTFNHLACKLADSAASTLKNLKVSFWPFRGRRCWSYRWLRT